MPCCGLATPASGQKMVTNGIVVSCSEPLGLDMDKCIKTRVFSCLQIKNQEQAIRIHIPSAISRTRMPVKHSEGDWKRWNSAATLHSSISLVTATVVTTTILLPAGHPVPTRVLKRQKYKQTPEEVTVLAHHFNTPCSLFLVPVLTTAEEWDVFERGGKELRL